MSAITKISSIFKSNKMSTAAKVIGVATGISVLYDSHVNGKEKAFVTDMNDTADRFSRQYNQYMTCDKESAVICKLKKMWYEMQQDVQSFHLISKLKGYAAGFGSTLLNALPFVGLSAVAIKSKGNLGKVSAVLLALNGLKTIIYDVMGIGVRHKQKF